MYWEFAEKYQSRRKLQAQLYKDFVAMYQAMAEQKPPAAPRQETKATKGDDVQTTYQFKENDITTTPPGQNRGVILSHLLKGEPPDAPHPTKPPQYQGKTLDSQRRMEANLLSLGAGYTVSRSKLFQEGENDEDIKSLTTQEHREVTKELTKTLGENQSEQTKDIGVFLGSYRPNQEELSHETTCPRFLTHQGVTDNLNHFKPDSELEVIEDTSRQTGFEVPSAIGPKIELHSPNHSQSRPTTTWRMLMDPSWFHQAKETKKNPKEAQFVTKIQEHVYLVPFKGNARPDRFSGLQTYTWRPGEESKNSGEPSLILPCTRIQRIRRILSCLHLPYLEPSAFLPFLLVHDLEAFSTFKKVSRQHSFMPKLSRYKESYIPKDMLENCTLFPYLRFCPTGFSEEGFNEATPLVCMKTRTCSPTTMLHKSSNSARNVILVVALPMLILSLIYLSLKPIFYMLFYVLVNCGLKPNFNYVFILFGLLAQL